VTIPSDNSDTAIRTRFLGDIDGLSIRYASRLTRPDQAWLALLAGALSAGRLAGLWLIVAPATILRRVMGAPEGPR
jgi:hypothetical protein